MFNYTHLCQLEEHCPKETTNSEQLLKYRINIIMINRGALEAVSGFGLHSNTQFLDDQCNVIWKLAFDLAQKFSKSFPTQNKHRGVKVQSNSCSLSKCGQHNIIVNTVGLKRTHKIQAGLQINNINELQASLPTVDQLEHTLSRL